MSWAKEEHNLVQVVQCLRGFDYPLKLEDPMKTQYSNAGTDKLQEFFWNIPAQQCGNYFYEKCQKSAPALF